MDPEIGEGFRHDIEEFTREKKRPDDRDAERGDGDDETPPELLEMCEKREGFR